jgi:hypothetical protein
MKQFLLSLLCIGLLSSCATRKYGCGSTYTYTPTSDTPKPILVSGTVTNTNVTKPDLFKKMYKNTNYVPIKMDLCRGYGKVAVIDTSTHPYSLLIRVGGAFIRNDVEVTPVKYVIVYETVTKNSLFWQIKQLIGREIYFECQAPSSTIDSPEMTHVVEGCVEHYTTANYVDASGVIHFTKM